MLLFRKELAQYGQVFVTTDDGSYGIKGNVSVVINDLDSQFDAALLMWGAWNDEVYQSNLL